MRNIITYLSALAVAVAVTGCSGKSENPEARMLFTQAEEAYNIGDYSMAIQMLDSLQKNYASETKLQRESMSLRPRIIEAEALRSITSVDSIYNLDIATLEAIKPQLKWIKTPGMIEGYWIAPENYRSDFMNTTGVEARVSEIGEFYIVSSVNPAGGLHHNALTLNVAGKTAKTPVVPYDGESNYRIEGGEVITFSPEQSDSIGALALSAVRANNTQGAMLTFSGDKGKKTIKLSPSQVEAIAKAYDYSRATERARNSQVERERLTRTIEIARRQQAQTAQSEKE